MTARIPGFAALFALSILLAAAAPLPVSAASGVDFVTLRVEDGTESVRIELPATVLEYVLDHSGTDLDMGKVDGRPMKFPKEALLKIVRGGQAKEKEVLAFTAKDGARETRLFVRTQARPAPTTLRKPMHVVFSVKDKAGKDSVRLAISLETVETWASGYGKGESDDFGPFVRSCLAQAKALGRGPILRIESADGVVSFEVE